MDEDQKERFKEIIKIVLDTSRSKGWGAYVATKDKKYRYASIRVSRQMGLQEITGNFDIEVDKRVKISTQKTSFYDYGLEDLRDSIWSKIKQLSWLKSAKSPEREISIEDIKHLHKEYWKFVWRKTAMVLKKPVPIVIEILIGLIIIYIAYKFGWNK